MASARPHALNDDHLFLDRTHDGTNVDLCGWAGQAYAAGSPPDRLDQSLRPERLGDLEQMVPRQAVGFGNLADGGTAIRTKRQIDEHSQRIIGVEGHTHGSNPSGAASQTSDDDQNQEHGLEPLQHDVNQMVRRRGDDLTGDDLGDPLIQDRKQPETLGGQNRP